MTVSQYIQRALAMKEAGRLDEADILWRRVLALQPVSGKAYMGWLMNSLPRVAVTELQSHEAPVRFTAALAQLEQWASVPSHLVALGEGVGGAQPFLLAYRPGNHRTALSRYGDLMARARLAWAAEAGYRLPEALPPRRQRLRLVVVSRHLHRHSVWDIMLRGLVQHLDRSRFELFLYHTGTKSDSETAWAADAADRFVHGPRDWLAEVLQDAPDVLYYPEIGMDPDVVRLAALRLAPLQVAGWGHPVTTGLPTIDLFLSGELLEGPAAADHYREQLVCLPGTGVCTSPLPYQVEPLDAASLNLPADRSVARLLICQTASKFDPAWDTLLVQIVQQSNPCVLCLIRDINVPQSFELVFKRLETAFVQAGLEPAQCLRVLDWQSGPRFWGVLDLMDLYLDLPAFSGYTTAWQALHRGLPIVTLEGEFLRQRLAAGLLRQVGLTETIATTADEYLCLTVRMARIPELRAELRLRLQGAVHLADNNFQPVRAFETVLLQETASRGVVPAAFTEDLPGLRQTIQQAQQLHQSGRLPEAQMLYHEILQVAPEHSEVLYLSAVCAHQQRDLALALAHSSKATAITPGEGRYHNQYGIALQALGRLAEAETAYRAAGVLQPGYAKAEANLGTVLQAQGRLPEAVAAYRQALLIEPDFVAVLSNLGDTLMQIDQFTEAAAAYHRAVSLQPAFAKACNNMGNALLALGHIDHALTYYRQAFTSQPGYTKAYSNLLLVYNYLHPPIQDLSIEYCRFGSLCEDMAGFRYSLWSCHSAPERLRVGVVSGDIWQHPVGFFLEGAVRELNRSRVELYAYVTNPKEDRLTARIKPCFTAWRSLAGLSDQAAAQLIHDDGIHILIDLSGHTAHNRLPLFAWKPAPVQVTWLGYFATTGVAEIDYILVDETGVPKGQEGQFTEKVWYLPDTRLCFTPPDNAPKVAPLPALTEGVGTFGCFQQRAKVNEATMALWGMVYAALPTARLRWQCSQFADEAVRSQALERLAAVGIDAARVELVGPATRQEYLAAHAWVDLILDSFPYTGGTTTCEALWMGVPTLTLAGDTLLSRQGASLMTAADLPDWVAHSKEEFVAKVVAFTATNEALDQLAELRQGLRSKVAASPLFDATRFARNLEQALWEMWKTTGQQ